jgi:hypothetical protein
MSNAPLRTYGFDYECMGRRFVFDVLAASPEEARDRVASMKDATFVGELLRSQDAPDGLGSSSI